MGEFRLSTFASLARGCQLIFWIFQENIDFNKKEMDSTALTPNKVPSNPNILTPRRKIFPPAVAPISPKLIRERSSTPKVAEKTDMSVKSVAEKFMKSVTENRLLNEIIELKGQLNENNLKLEDYQEKILHLKNADAENQNFSKEIDDLKSKIQECLGENTQSKKDNSELKGLLHEAKLKMEQYEVEIAHLKNADSENQNQLKEINDLQLRLLEGLAENTQLKEERSEVQIFLPELKRQLEETKTDLKKTDSENQKFSEEIDDVKSKLLEFSTETTQLKKEKSEQKKINEGEITLLKKKIKEDEDEIYKLKKVISESRIPCARKAPNIKEVNIQPTRASVLRAQRNQNQTQQSNARNHDINQNQKTNSDKQ